MTLLKKILGISVCAGTVSSWYTLHKYDYDLNSLGIVRLSRAGATAVAIGYHYNSKLYGSRLNPDSVEYARLRSIVHTEAANMLLKLCCTNKGVYIKVGQHIGALDYLVPPEYVDVMKVLHSKAPASSYREILKVLKEDLQCDPFDVFSHIEEKPLGAASLAQVHKATLKDNGTSVAVKVQHPLVLRNSIVDMKTMEVLVNVMSYFFKDFNFQWLVDATKKNLPKELDFRHEAENAEKVRKQLNNFKWLKVPTIYWNLTTQRVLTMEFMEGGQVNDLEYIKKLKISHSSVTSKLGQMYAHMIFKHGFVHSDPHPGNILLHVDKGVLNLVLLDHGLYADLSDDFRLSYSKFWMSILARDMEGMRQHSIALGIGELFPLLVCMVTGRTWNSVTAGVDKVQYSESEKITFQKEIPEYLTQIGVVLEKVNRQMLLVLKTNDLLRGIEHTLNTHRRESSFLSMTKCCMENIYKEKLALCCTTLQRFRITLEKMFVLCKLNAYSLYLTIADIVRSHNAKA